MAIKTPDTLKGYFNDGDVPNGAEYVDLIDTLSNNPGNAVSFYKTLIGLRGFWPMSSIGETGAIYDFSEQGKVLSKTGTNPTLGTSDTLTAGMPYGLFYASNYLSRVDDAGLSVTGSESYIHSSYQGLTIGAWFRLTVTPANTANPIISKYLTVGNQRSYMLYYYLPSYHLRFGISSDGANFYYAESPASVPITTWHFVVGRFKPSTHVGIYLNGTWTYNTTSIPATIFDSTSRFELGAYDAGLYTFSHNGSFYFITASALTDGIIQRMYDLTKNLFTTQLEI